jgi:hypothetical protein
LPVAPGVQYDLKTPAKESAMRRLLPLFAVLSLAFAPAPLPRPPKATPASAHLQAMQGHWDRASLTYGEHRTEGGEANIRVVGQKVAFFLGNRLRDEWSISLRPDKGANRFEAKIISGDLKGRTLSGTYRLQGDVLVLSYQQTIPEGLLVDANQVLVVLTYKRKKP